jgi:hypothetical protein
MRKRNWSLFAALVALAALAALSIGSAGSAVAASASASAAGAAGGEKATAARRRGRRGPRGRRGRRGRRGPAGPAGAPGPQGPAGTVSNGGTVSGGGTKIFFAVNGVGPTQTLIDVNNLNLQNSCDGSVQQPEFRTSLDNATIRHMGVDDDGTDDDEFYDEDDDFDIGEAYNEANADLPEDDAVIDLLYGNIIGQLVKVNYTVEEDANDVFVSTDCLLIGVYWAL